MSRADAPVAGRRPCRWSSPIAGTFRMARPRSAVTVWPSAPALTRLTGFSRSGRSSSLGWLASDGEALVRGAAPSLSLTAECGHPVESRCTILSAPVVSSEVHQPPGTSQGAGRLLRVLLGTATSAFRLIGPGHLAGGLAFAPTTPAPEVAWAAVPTAYDREDR